MKVTLWTTDDCPKCEEAKALLAASGIEHEIRTGADLTSGAEQNADALVQLAMQDMAMPIIKVDNTYTDLESLRALLLTAPARQGGQ